MSATLKYAACGVAGVTIVTLGLWPFLDSAGRNGVLVAGAVALPVQIVAFAVLLRFRGELNGFLAAWAGGMVVRTLVLAVVAFIVIRSGTEGAVPMLLALAGFFFGLLLLEPVWFRPESNQTVEA